MQAQHLLATAQRLQGMAFLSDLVSSLPPPLILEVPMQPFVVRTQTARKLIVLHETVKNQGKVPKYTDGVLMAWGIQQSLFQAQPWAALDSSCS